MVRVGSGAAERYRDPVFGAAGSGDPSRITRMDADRSDAPARLLEAGTTGRIIPAFFAVYNNLGFGRLESVYRNALQVELTFRGVPWEKEVLFPVHYRGVQVGLYRCDLLVERRVIVEVKASHRLADADHRQLLNYL